MILDRLQRIALARLLSDLIEADFIVEETEMALFEDLISREGLNISESMLVVAKKMDMGKAVSILKETDSESRVEIVDVLKRMSMSDGECAPAESLMIFAIEQALVNGALVHSVPSRNVNIGNHTVLYVENEDETAVGRLVGENYESLCREFMKAGFDFIHIPHVVNDFSRMDRDYLEKAVRYMIPSVSGEKVGFICNDLCGLTTARFCRDLLYKRMGLYSLKNSPSLLLKIGESIIVDRFSSDDAERTDYSNFLQIEMSEDVMGQAARLLAGFISSDDSSCHTDRPHNSDKFIYKGFHRALFDLIAYGREQKDYRLVFDVSRPQASVYFEPLDGGERIHLKLTPQEVALFLLIARKSMEGEGLDWREHIPSEEKQAILAEYNRIYSFIGKGNISTEYKDRTHTNHIKNRIRVIQGIANIELFIPEHVREGGKSIYRIRAGAQIVLIVE